MPDNGADIGRFGFLILLAVLAIGGAMIKWIRKLLSEKEKGRIPRPGPQARGPAAGESGPSPEQALEQFFQEAKRKRARSEVQPATRADRPDSARSLDDFFGQTQGRPQAPAAAPPPVAQAIPVARPISAARKPAPRSRRAGQPAVTVAKPVDPYGSEAVAKAKASIARGRKRRRQPVAAARPVADLGLSGPLAGPLRREDLVRAVIYSEILGRPRAISPYSGPPAAG